MKFRNVPCVAGVAMLLPLSLEAQWLNYPTKALLEQPMASPTSPPQRHADPTANLTFPGSGSAFPST